MIKQLTVLIQGNTEIASRAYDELVALRQRLLQETQLSELSFLRGDLDFVLATLRGKERGYPVIAILDRETYRDYQKRDSVLNAGAALVYIFSGSTEEELVTRTEECVRHFLGQRQAKGKRIPKEKKYLPDEVRARIRRIWPNNQEHAAKQAACYLLDLQSVFAHDHDRVVNICLRTGLLAQRCVSVEAFIVAFEKEVLNT